jgi:hypothetical protein
VCGIVERALELARTGEVKSVTKLKQRLRLEGFTAAEIGGIGPALTRQLAGTVKEAVSQATEIKSGPVAPMRRTRKVKAGPLHVPATGSEAGAQSDRHPAHSRGPVQVRS